MFVTYIKILIILFCLVVIQSCVTGGKELANTKTVQPVQKTEDTKRADSDITGAKNDSVGNPAVSGLSPASQLMIKACDNYLIVNPENLKAAEVLNIKASLLYNNKMYEQSRGVYNEIAEKYPGSPNAMEAMRMIAQAYYEEKLFDKAQEWYRKISDMASDGVGKQEALTRLAESIFRMAETYEEQNRFKDASTQYERVALEFPESKIADVALFNAGLAYEKQTEWSHAILVFQRLMQKYPDSKIVSKAQFRTAKSYEKLLQWDLAAEAYLKVTAKYPHSDLASVALYNAAFCFENGEKLVEAAATFEKMAQLFPKAEDAADVLFRAGEIYGKLKDWESVARVNQMFTERYGNDQDRIVQALCMSGIAFYMQNKEANALEQLEKAVTTFTRLKKPSTQNAYYAAKAMFTVGEINHTSMKNVQLSSQKNLYKKQLMQKSDLLDKTLEAYTRVVKFNISEWTTRSIFQIGQAYEDFAFGIFRQQRPASASLEEQIALELGIAQAVEKYFVSKAVHFHEQNVKLGIKEKIEDKYVLQSRQKLTYLPYVAGENYLKLVEIAKGAQGKGQQEGFALIAGKLQVLQKIAPFQEKAIDLFLKCLEMGTTYQETNDFYKKASASITRISFEVGETYADVVKIARDAPIPGNFDAYEKFIYKTKLLKQIEEYENQALTNYLKTVKIAEAYKLYDESVRNSQTRIAQLLFNKGRCLDLLCTSAFSDPPFPSNINEAEKEEYKARFEEIGLKFQEQAFDVYKSVLDYASQNYASGDYVTHAYIRLFQNFPDGYGSKEDKLVESSISSGSQWKCIGDSVGNWFGFEFNDSSWAKAQKAIYNDSVSVAGFPGSPPLPMWLGTGNPKDKEDYKPYKTIYFRRTFTTSDMPHSAKLYLAANGKATVYINGELLTIDSSATLDSKADTWDLMGKIRNGKNVLAVNVVSNNDSEKGFIPLIQMMVTTQVPLPKPPGFEKALPLEKVGVDVYKFPEIKNFSIEKKEAQQ